MAKRKPRDTERIKGNDPDKPDRDLPMTWNERRLVDDLLKDFPQLTEEEALAWVNET